MPQSQRRGQGADVRRQSPPALRLSGFYSPVVLPGFEQFPIRKGVLAVKACDCYLRRRQFFYQIRRKGLELARQMFARATVIDPGYARAYAGVADCWFVSVHVV